MNAMPDLATYKDPTLTPPDDSCPSCGEWSCGPDCRLSWRSPYMARRTRARVENGDPES